VSGALGLLRREDDRYALTPLAEDYLPETSPTSFGSYLDFFIANAATYSFERVKQAVLTDAPQGYDGADLFKTHEERAERAHAFTRAMHSRSLAPALAWPDALDLSRHRVLLDAGGGSGAHAIGAALRWPNLEVVVFDLGPVCEVAAEVVASYGLQDRVRTYVGDMWDGSFPAADVHFYSLVYHDWPPERCRELTRKSFERLPPGGRIILHEMLYDDDKTGPFTVAALTVQMLLWAPGASSIRGGNWPRCLPRRDSPRSRSGRPSATGASSPVASPRRDRGRPVGPCVVWRVPSLGPMARRQSDPITGSLWRRALAAGRGRPGIDSSVNNRPRLGQDDLIGAGRRLGGLAGTRERDGGNQHAQRRQDDDDDERGLEGIERRGLSCPRAADGARVARS
jgi:SAM-dependent methyltransferase